MAQGVANFVVPFFGGIPATGTIARTVTNVRAGAASPVAGIVHALTLLAIVLVAAPLAAHVPLAVLAGILLFVAWNMGEWREFAPAAALQRSTTGTMLVATFLLTVVVRPDGRGRGRAGAGLRLLHLPHEHAVPRRGRRRRRCRRRARLRALRLAVLRRGRASSRRWPNRLPRRHARGGAGDAPAGARSTRPGSTRSSSCTACCSASRRGCCSARSTTSRCG